MKPDQADRLSAVLAEVGREVEQAVAKHAPMNSAHEAYAVILEELDEVWDEVKKKREARSDDRLRRELVQTAAMAIRALVDLKLDA